MDYQNRRFVNRNMYRQPQCGMNTQRNQNPEMDMNRQIPLDNSCRCDEDSQMISPEYRQSKNYSFPGPIAMGYVPMQEFENIYPRQKGFQEGTIFADLNLPFLMTPCYRGGQI